MTPASARSRTRSSSATLHALVFLAGAAALSWEVLWQLEAALAIGVSAKGTAITLAASMGGMSLGAWGAGRWLHARAPLRPLRVYGSLEVVVALSGVFFLLPGLRTLARLDGALYLSHPVLAPLLHLAGVFVVIAPAAIAMGATVPVFGAMAAATESSIATLYGANTAGAAVGALLVSFVVLPYCGVEVTAVALACVNLSVAAVAWMSPLALKAAPASSPTPAAAPKMDSFAALAVFVSGFVSFGLEVAWFRSLRAAFLSTTSSFAIMLAAVLFPLALGARLAAAAHARRIPLGAWLAAAGCATALATPVVERFDGIARLGALGFWGTSALWLGASCLVLGLPMLLLGVCLPWILRAHVDAAQWGRTYAFNTLGAVLGSIVAAWILLPAIGFGRTAWLLAAAMVLLALVFLEGPGRRVALAVGVGSLGVAVLADAGIGGRRLVGNFNGTVEKILAFYEAPDSSIAVARMTDGSRALVIDGFVATDESSASHYMVWMGRLPMLLHPAPASALVICFGTGQTANAVRQEGPRALDVVELNPEVLRAAPLFPANQDVLADPRVHAIVMDGRAWLRRTDHRYDVITLEPMPPNFAGVNSLYSEEFYRLAAARLKPGGLVAQWVPFHLLSVHDALAIAATFEAVFGDALLWIDPRDRTGILVGRVGIPSPAFGASWPGFARPSGSPRDLDEATVRAQVALRGSQAARYAALGELISDDNQLLAYGPARHREYFVTEALMQDNLAIVARTALTAR